MSVAELLAHALQIEVDAEERYKLLADQMETHNNIELAAMFRAFAGHEAHHADEIRAQMKGMRIPEIRPLDHKWPGTESPEAVDIGALRYNMMPWHALQLALQAERNAYGYFDEIAKAAEDPELKRWALEFRAEEEAHVALVLAELAKYPEPPPGWDEDPDPAMHQE
jgi:rubrerythrin